MTRQPCVTVMSHFTLSTKSSFLSLPKNVMRRRFSGAPSLASMNLNSSNFSKVKQSSTKRKPEVHFHKWEIIILPSESIPAHFKESNVAATPLGPYRKTSEGTGVVSKRDLNFSFMKVISLIEFSVEFGWSTIWPMICCTKVSLFPRLVFKFT